MSNIDRKEEKSISLSKSSRKNERINSNKDENRHYHRTRTNSSQSHLPLNFEQLSNLDAKVYVGNIPTDHLTDGELLNFFKQFGKISDIRVYKGYLFVQYQKIKDAKNLIKEGQTSLIFKGNKLDILPAMDGIVNDRKSSKLERSYQNNQNLNEQSFQNSRQYSDHDRHSTNYQPPRKRSAHEDHTNDNGRYRNYFRDSNEMQIDDNRSIDLISPSRNCSTNQSSYRILKGSDHSKESIHCRIILVNSRQKEYAEEISSRLDRDNLFTSIVVLRGNVTLTEAIEDTANDRCLYGIILMPMHEERHTGSFHILHGRREEHRNISLEDGLHLILTNFSRYKEDFQNEKFVYSQTKEFVDHENEICLSSRKMFNEKYPLSMLLCLLADGRQLTLDEIDRILFYLLEKKAKMLTLPQGTLPPLPQQYSTNQLKTNSTMVEQIEKIVSTNLTKSSYENNENQTTIENDQENSSFSYLNSLPIISSRRYSNQIHSSTLTNSSAADAAAAIFQAYSQFNRQTTTN